MGGLSQWLLSLWLEYSRVRYMGGLSQWLLSLWLEYDWLRAGMDDILVCLLCIDATGIQSNMRVFVSTFDC